MNFLSLVMELVHSLRRYMMITVRCFIRNLFTMTCYNSHTNLGLRRCCQRPFSRLRCQEQGTVNGLFLWLLSPWASTRSHCGYPLLRSSGHWLRVVLCALGIWMGVSASIADMSLYHGDGQLAVKLFPWSVRIRGVVNGWH